MKGDFLICNNHQHAMVIWNDKDDNCPLCKAERNLKIQSEMIDELTKQPPDQLEKTMKLQIHFETVRTLEAKLNNMIVDVKEILVEIREMQIGHKGT